MPTYLDKILEVKKAEAAKLKRKLLADKHHPLHKVLHLDLDKHVKPPSFRSALAKPGLAVIAEIKRKSPSAGQIGFITDPLQLASQYTQGGASAISVLTDETFFGGSLNDLQSLANAPHISGKVPLLRKDFVIDPLQIAEAYLAGASAVLLIMAALGNKIGELMKYAEALGLDVLVEVHDKAELNMALETAPKIIGINNRNLSTFEVSLSISENLAPEIPSEILKVAESGIHTPADAERMQTAGFDGILVGEALVKAQDPAALIQNMRGNHRIEIR